VIIDSLPQGQGHRTVTAQVVGDVFGLPASRCGSKPRSIPDGTLVDRRRELFQPLWPCATAGAAYLAATRLRDKLARIAAAQLNLPPEEVRFAGGASSPPQTRKTP